MENYRHVYRVLTRRLTDFEMILKKKYAVIDHKRRKELEGCSLWNLKEEFSDSLELCTFDICKTLDALWIVWPFDPISLSLRNFLNLKKWSKRLIIIRFLSRIKMNRDNFRTKKSVILLVCKIEDTDVD